ncbi:MAG: archaeosine biosynthesis radical SAM protein RaSEA [Halococcoides sp.]
MSQGRPDATNAFNGVMRDIRARNDEQYDPREPIRVWTDEDLTPEGVRTSLTAVLNTGGCRWARAGGCTMCGYVAESVPDGSVASEDVLAQIDAIEAHEADALDEPAPLVKLYTSGSFLDERELSGATREAIVERFGDRARIVVESLPEFMTADRLDPLASIGPEIDVAVGLETASDRIRQECINKVFTFEEFATASEVAADRGVGVKAYLLLKPPFLSESEALDDAVESVRRTAEYAHTVSVNPTNVQQYTLVEDLYHADGYRPPWLWSVAAVLDRTADVDAIVVSDPVGKGSSRGPHNCGECDDRVARAIEDFDRRQEPAVFEEVSCACEATWAEVLDREKSFGMVLAA